MLRPPCERERVSVGCPSSPSWSPPSCILRPCHAPKHIRCARAAGCTTLPLPPLPQPSNVPPSPPPPPTSPPSTPPLTPTPPRPPVPPPPWPPRVCAAARHARSRPRVTFAVGRASRSQSAARAAWWCVEGEHMDGRVPREEWVGGWAASGQGEAIGRRTAGSAGGRTDVAGGRRAAILGRFPHSSGLAGARRATCHVGGSA